MDDSFYWMLFGILVAICFLSFCVKDTSKGAWLGGCTGRDLKIFVCVYLLVAIIIAGVDSAILPVCLFVLLLVVVACSGEQETPRDHDNLHLQAIGATNVYDRFLGVFDLLPGDTAHWRPVYKRRGKVVIKDAYEDIFLYHHDDNHWVVGPNWRAGIARYWQARSIARIPSRIEPLSWHRMTTQEEEDDMMGIWFRQPVDISKALPERSDDGVTAVQVGGYGPETVARTPPTAPITLIMV